MRFPTNVRTIQAPLDQIFPADEVDIFLMIVFIFPNFFSAVLKNTSGFVYIAQGFLLAFNKKILDFHAS